MAHTPKPLTLRTTLALLTLPIVGIIVLGIWSSTSIRAANCPSNGHIIKLAYIGNSLAPAKLTTTRCSVLRITNTDTKPHQTAMGAHDHHTHYPGLDDDTPLVPGSSIDLLLVRSGTYRIHDHFDDDTHTTITIK